MGWNHKTLDAIFRKRASDMYADKSNTELIDRIIQLEVAAYGFDHTLYSLNEESWRGTHATSPLFPSTQEDEQHRTTVFVFSVDGNYKHELSGKRIPIKDIAESDLHRYEYGERESIDIKDGRQLDDDFDIIAVHQQAPGAYVGCGSIDMGDIRHLNKVLYPERPKSE